MKSSMWFINRFLRNKKAVFTPVYFKNEVNWVAANRAAKRFLKSNRIKNLAKLNDVNIIEDEKLLILN